MSIGRWYNLHSTAMGQCYETSEPVNPDKADFLDKLDLQGWPEAESFKEGSETSEQHLKTLAKLKSPDLYEEKLKCSLKQFISHA